MRRLLDGIFLAVVVVPAVAAVAVGDSASATAANLVSLSWTDSDCCCCYYYYWNHYYCCYYYYYYYWN